MENYRLPFLFLFVNVLIVSSVLSFTGSSHDKHTRSTSKDGPISRNLVTKIYTAVALKMLDHDKELGVSKPFHLKDFKISSLKMATNMIELNLELKIQDRTERNLTCRFEMKDKNPEGIPNIFLDTRNICTTGKIEKHPIDKWTFHDKHTRSTATNKSSKEATKNGPTSRNLVTKIYTAIALKMLDHDKELGVSKPYQLKDFKISTLKMASNMIEINLELKIQDKAKKNLTCRFEMKDKNAEGIPNIFLDTRNICTTGKIEMDLIDKLYKMIKIGRNRQLQ